MIGRVNFLKDFWDCYLARSQCSDPRNNCGMHLAPVSSWFLKWRVAQWHLMITAHVSTPWPLHVISQDWKRAVHRTIFIESAVKMRESTLSTHLIEQNLCVLLPKRRKSAVSLETKTFIDLWRCERLMCADVLVLTVFLSLFFFFR